jgi:hypothetical protein
MKQLVPKILVGVGLLGAIVPSFAPLMHLDLGAAQSIVQGVGSVVALVGALTHEAPTELLGDQAFQDKAGRVLGLLGAAAHVASFSMPPSAQPIVAAIGSAVLAAGAWIHQPLTLGGPNTTPPPSQGNLSDLKP